jgi:hypothetical protein
MMRWFIEDDDLLVRLQDDRDPDGATPPGGTFGFYSLARRRGRWVEDPAAVDVFGMGGTSGAREITEAQGRIIEAEWLADGADRAP